MLKPYIKKVAERENLTLEQAKEAMTIIVEGKATEAQIAGFICLMRMKGETVEEITGFATVMREHAIKIKQPQNKLVVDTCGTGGDKSNTFNVSTIAAFVVSGAGLAVAKHGNRAVSSQCGSADVLLELGVNIEVPVEVVEKCLNEIDIAFLFAPSLHPAMKYAIGPRRQLGIRTFFNLLGPLTNPACVDRQVIGLFSDSWRELVAQVLKNMGSKQAMIVHGQDGLDELSLCAPTNITELCNDGSIKNYTVSPEDLGLARAELSDLSGADKKTNARIAREILDGAKGPKTDMVLLNAAAAIYIGGLADSLAKGIELARKSIESGAAKQKLDALIKMSRES